MLPDESSEVVQPRSDRTDISIQSTTEAAIPSILGAGSAAEPLSLERVGSQEIGNNQMTKAR